MSISYGGDYITDTDGGKLRPSSAVMRNRIINGAMVIDQRNAGASVTITNTAALTYTLDRWAGYGSQASKFSIQQSSTAPAGFTNSLLATSASAYSVGSTEIFKFTEIIEGYNIADLGWGTANAKTVTLSFWVRSSLTGTFGGGVLNSAFNRSYPFSYTINVANTWEQKTVTIAGDTSGTWLTTNGIGMQVIWSLGAGSSASGTAGAWTAGNVQSATGATSVVGTNGATFYITGVQLEVGSSATGFEYRQYGQELALCQRYYWQIVNGDQNNIGSGVYYSTSTFICSVQFPVTMRTAPTLSYVTGTAYYVIYGNNTSDTIDGFYLGATSPITTNVESGGQGAGGTAGYGGQMRSNNASAKTAFTAEL